MEGWGIFGRECHCVCVTVELVSSVYHCTCRTVLHCNQRVYRDEWPLLTFETEVHGDSKITNESGPSLVNS